MELSTLFFRRHRTFLVWNLWILWFKIILWRKLFLMLILFCRTRKWIEINILNNYIIIAIILMRVVDLSHSAHGCSILRAKFFYLNIFILNRLLGRLILFILWCATYSHLWNDLIIFLGIILHLFLKDWAIFINKLGVNNDFKFINYEKIFKKIIISYSF